MLFILLINSIDNYKTLYVILQDPSVIFMGLADLSLFIEQVFGVAHTNISQYYSPIHIWIIHQMCNINYPIAL